MSGVSMADKRSVRGQGSRRGGTGTGRRKTPMDIHVASRLLAARLAAGWSQVSLAMAVGVTFQTIQKREKGVDRITAGALWATAEALGVAVGWFFETEGGA